jgi:16S rRNA (cytosine967-C5)-methyltransferase
MLKVADTKGKDGSGGRAPGKRSRKGRGRPAAKTLDDSEKNSAPTLTRLLATRVLERVERSQAYADIALHHALSRSPLTGVDRALTTELVYGTLRWRGRLDFFLSQMLNQELKTLDPLVATTLRLGAYQLLFSDRIPASAAVDQAVRCTRAVGNTRATGLVNAVLRRLSREWQTIVPPRLEDDPIPHLVHALSMPEWMAKRFLDLYGPEGAAAFAKACNQPPEITVRVNRTKADRDTLLEQLQETVPKARAGRYAPDAIRLGHIGDLGLDASFRQGLYSVQDEASQLVIEMLDPQPGEFILDTCAAPGSKTTGIGERLAGKGGVLGLDRNGRRLKMVEQTVRRLELSAVHTLKRDATLPLTDLTLPGKEDSQELPRFDRILVDAPCSGLGSLRRNPDARWRVREADPGRLAAIQQTLLIRAAAVLRRGGTLVYSTCTVLPEEDEDQINRFLEQNPNFRQVPASELPASLADVVDQQGTLRLTPHEHGTDGFYAARLERIE